MRTSKISIVYSVLLSASCPCQHEQIESVDQCSVLKHAKSSIVMLRFSKRKGKLTLTSHGWHEQNVTQQVWFNLDPNKAKTNAVL